MAKKKRTGPRGGTTTVNDRGLIRKTLWIHEDENEGLRRAAFEERTSETEIVRRLLRKYLKIAD